MTHLILTVISIALTALIVLASISYLPWWHKAASDIEGTVRSSLHLFEQAYDIAVRENEGIAPLVDSVSVDGGLAANFLPILQFLPPAAPQFHWKYGQAYGMDYFCMESEGLIVNEGIVKGVTHAKLVFSEDQVFVNTTCGAHSNTNVFSPDGSAIALTMYVAYVPGISR